MAVAVVDTGVLIGRADTDDRHHRTATEIVRGIDHGELPTGQVLDPVILETLNWIHERKRHETAIETYSRLNRSAGFEIVQTARKDFRRAVELFEQYDQLAFGDAMIAAYMDREGIEYCYSFDDDFDGLQWITPLETPENPYS